MKKKQKKMVGEMVRILGLPAILIVVLGLAYPLVVSGIARLDGSRAEGRFVYVDGQEEPVGAEEIGQSFTSPGYFHGRPSAAGTGYDPMFSGASNLGPTNPELEELAEARLERFLDENPGVAAGNVPVEMVTASASGLDPDISEESALLQVPRVSRETGIPEGGLEAMIRDHVEGRFLWLFGQARVNVLELNLEVLRMQGEE